MLGNENETENGPLLHLTLTIRAIRNEDKVRSWVLEVWFVDENEAE